MSIYHDLCQLIADYNADHQSVKSNQELSQVYIDEFYDMLVRLRDKMDQVREALYEED